MKKIGLFISAFLLVIFTNQAQEQTPATEAGEDFDLNAVMEVLQNSEDLADFEKKINDEKNQVNNLDLNKDDEIDIIKVVEYDEDNTRVIALRAVLGENDFQDIASIEIEKHSEEEISLQVIGDPDLYGPDFIVEPAPDDSSQGEGGGDSFESLPILPDEVTALVFVSVHRWRPIGPLFVIGRIAFVSAVGWRPMAVWFVVRRPIARATWRGRSRHYRSARYRSSRARHSSHGKRMYSNNRKKSNVAKKNAGPKPSPNKGPNSGPSKQPKKATTSPSKSRAPNNKHKANTPKSKPSNNKKSGPQKKSSGRRR